MLRPSVYSLSPSSPLRRQLCRFVGCRWDERTGYDWCPRCSTSRWHIARDGERRPSP